MISRFFHGSHVLPSRPSTLYFRHVRCKCNTRAFHRCGARSKWHSRTQTTKDGRFCSLLLYSCRLLGLHWPNKSKSSQSRGDWRRPSTPYCLHRHKCNFRVSHHFEEHRKLCSSRHTTQADTFYFRLLHNCNVRRRHHEGCIVCDSQNQTTMVGTLSYHPTACICDSRKEKFYL